jgi:hypothetical protein
MRRRDFHLLAVIKEIENGCYGSVDKTFKLFTLVEKRALAEALIMLYKTANCMRSLDKLFNMIMTDFYIRLKDKEEVVFYNPFGFDTREDKKLRFIIKLFLPIEFRFVIHWEYTYGSVDHDESMAIDGFVL